MMTPARILNLVLITVLSGCDLGAAIDTAESFDPIIAVTEADVEVAGLILDARTGAPISEEVVITFSGPVSDLAEDIFGHRFERLVAVGGAASFAISNTVNPSLNEPIELRMHASAQGYRPTATRLAIRGPGRHEFRLILDRLDLPLASGAQGQERFELVAGFNQARIELPAIEGGSTRASLVVPAGSHLITDGRGSANGPMSISVTHTPPSEDLFATFPGGLDAGLQSDNGAIAQTTLTTGGVVEIRGETANGATWTRLEGADLEITAVLDLELFNPDSNERAQPGDQVEIHEWLPSRGVWRIQSQALIQGVSAAKTVTFTASRPGLFSMGYRTAHCDAGKLLLHNNTMGGSFVAFRGDRDDADGVRVWRFPPGAEELVLGDPPDFWRGKAYVLHGDQEIAISYDGICGLTFEATLGQAVAKAVNWSLEPKGCTSLRLINLPTLAISVQSHARIPAGAADRLVEGPYFHPAPSFPRDALGRPIRIEASGIVTAGDAEVRLVLGGQSWTYSDPNPGPASTLDISNFANSTGLCVGR